MALPREYTDDELDHVEVLEHIALSMNETAAIAADNDAHGSAAIHRLVARLALKLIEAKRVR